MHKYLFLDLLKYYSKASFQLISPQGPFYNRHSYVPDKSPATKVETMGVFLSLTRARNEKSRPSRAIAKIMRGSGNMEPRRLSQG